MADDNTPDLPAVPPESSEKQPMLLPSQMSRPVFLMAPPFSVSAETPNNVFMQGQSSPEGRVFNRDKAMRQFIDVYSFLSSMALVYLLPAKDGLQDLPYVANMGVVLPHYAADTVVLSNFASPPRRGETAVGKAFFDQMGYETVVAPERFEGEADLKYLGGNTYAGAWGSRTSSGALAWFANNFGARVIPVHLTDPQGYHLDCALFPLSAERTLCAIDILDKADVIALEGVTEIIPVSTKMAHQGLTNCVRVNRVVLCGTQFEGWSPEDDYWQLERQKVDMLTSICAKYGFEPIFFDISEFAKSGAALSCMTMKLNYVEMKKTEE